MEYTKLQHRDTRMVAWRVASCRARGAAVSLLVYCSDQENAGKIVGAATWGSSTWLAAAAVSLTDVSAAVDAHLCVWEGADLVVRIYDHKGHRQLEVQRLQADHGTKGAGFGKLGGRPKKKPPEGDNDNPLAGIPRNPPSPPTPVHTSPVQPTPPSPAGTRRLTDDDGDDGLSPHDHRPEPGPPTQAIARHLTTAIIRREDAVDVRDVCAATKAGSSIAIVAAFGGNMHGGRRAEWRREADGLSNLMLVVLLADARARGKPIREPSGLRAARDHRMGELDREQSDELLALYGLKAPTPAKSSA